MSTTDPGPRVLVVDDEDNVAFLISAALRLAGYETLIATSGTRAVEEAGRFAPHVIVLDVMLPDIDGFEVLRRIRAGGASTPVLFVTARQATTDRVRGLTSGGDDYIVKPFELEELVARVQVALRRAGIGSEVSRLAVADLSLDLESRRVWRGAVEAHLTATEFNLLRVLMANAGRVVTREQILDSVWQYDFNGESSIIESFIRNLRRKVDSTEPKLIHTVRGVGYSVREP
ncbi:MAG TPA: response regulator transcription factor [Candidatus Nanopelagicales bacterium]